MVPNDPKGRWTFALAVVALAALIAGPVAWRLRAPPRQGLAAVFARLHKGMAADRVVEVMRPYCDRADKDIRIIGIGKDGRRFNMVLWQPRPPASEGYARPPAIAALPVRNHVGRGDPPEGAVPPPAGIAHASIVLTSDAEGEIDVDIVGGVAEEPGLHEWPRPGMQGWRWLRQLLGR